MHPVHRYRVTIEALDSAGQPSGELLSTVLRSSTRLVSLEASSVAEIQVGLSRGNASSSLIYSLQPEPSPQR